MTQPFLPDRARYTPPATREEVESRMGVEPVDQRTAERAFLVKQNAKRRALYGSTATWKFHRDRLEALIAMEKRRAAVAEGVKVTDKAIAEMVLTDDRMKAFIEAAEEEMVAYHVTEDQIEAIADRGQRDTEVARYVAGELRLAQ